MRWYGLQVEVLQFSQERLQHHKQKGLSDVQVVVVADLQQFESYHPRIVSEFGQVPSRV